MVGSETLLPFEDSRPLLHDADAIKERMERDGYLFISQLVPEDDVREVSDAIQQICRKEGWMDEKGYPTREPVLEGQTEWFIVYDKVQCLEAFHALAHHPNILQVIESIVREPVFVHPRNIARIVFPGTDYYATPPHQDYVHIQGAFETYTVWIPLTDCPLEVGPLAMLPGSHKLGLLPVHLAAGAGGLGVEVGNSEQDWRSQDMRAGDALIFHSLTVHRALPNKSNSSFRISVDYRYQGVSQPIAEDALLPHYGRLSWEQIYSGWKRTDIQYYWRNLNLNFVPRDPSLTTPEEAKHKEEVVGLTG
ncbi:MAG: phytanoyl-CoA dioxygenase family protein, partial [Armatimonadota bacterium]|nr:phytanoyl-CoA dioxygenase family protein [Armatimonadota bacterium]